MAIANFSDINWGPDEAKGDDDLRTYFVPFPEFSAIRKGQFRYVIGRKGTGKTAVIERIRLETENDPTSFRSSLSLRDFPLHEFRELRDKSYRDKSQFVAAWSLLIYIELAKLVVKDQGATPREVVDELQEFLTINSIVGSTGFSEVVTTLRKSEHKLKVAAGWLEGESGGGSESHTQSGIHYKRVVDLLLERLRNITSSSQYWIFIDELDEGFRAGDSSLRLLLLALLRAVEDTALSARSQSLDYRPLLVLRSDIFDRLEDNDLNKLDDYVMRLKWKSNGVVDGYSLKEIPVARISASLPSHTTPWDLVVVDNDPDLPKNVISIWSYLSSRTYERPRDIIKFLKYCAKHCGPGKLTFAAVKKAEDQYSDWLYREIRDEIHSYLPCWRESLQCLTRIGRGKLTVVDYSNELVADRTIKKWFDDEGKSPADLIETLFDFGILGNLDGSRRWLFKYKDADLAWNPKMDLIVHFGLLKKLRILH